MSCKMFFDNLPVMIHRRVLTRWLLFHPGHRLIPKPKNKLYVAKHLAEAYGRSLRYLAACQFFDGFEESGLCNSARLQCLVSRDVEFMRLTRSRRPFFQRLRGKCEAGSVYEA